MVAEFKNISVLFCVLLFHLTDKIVMAAIRKSEDARKMRWISN
jgi:hypothetical protein